MFWLVLLTLAIKGIGASLINTVMFGLEADTVEYGEWKTGKRSEGATYALFSFTRKVTQSIGGAVGAWALAIGGYIAASAANPSPVQPDSAIIAIKATIGLLPALAALIAMLIFIKYPLNDESSSRSATRPRPASCADALVSMPRGRRTIVSASAEHLTSSARSEKREVIMSRADLTAAPYGLGLRSHCLGARHHRRRWISTRRSGSCSST